MSHHMLHDNMLRRIRRYEQYKWQETRGVEEESMIHNLPKDFRRDIKCHLCLKLLTRVPMFVKMGKQLLDAMYYRLKPDLYTEKSFIVCDGDPVDKMLFIMLGRGNVLTMTTNGGRTSFLNSDYLKARDFCGEDSKHIQHTFRKKIEKPLQEAEDRMHEASCCHLFVKFCYQYTLFSCASITHIIITPIT